MYEYEALLSIPGGLELERVEQSAGQLRRSQSTERHHHHHVVVLSSPAPARGSRAAGTEDIYSVYFIYFFCCRRLREKKKTKPNATTFPHHTVERSQIRGKGLDRQKIMTTTMKQRTCCKQNPPPPTHTVVPFITREHVASGGPGARIVPLHPIQVIDRKKS